MAINFPNSPSLNETYSENDTSWKWDGTSWNRLTGLVGTESSTLSGVGVTQFARRDVNNVITGITTLSTSGVGNTTLNVEGDSRFGSNVSIVGVTTTTGLLDVDGGITNTSGVSTAKVVSGGINLHNYGTSGHTFIRCKSEANVDTNIIRIQANNNDSSTGSDYGFNIKYRGSGSGNNNYLSFYGDNQTGTEVEALRIYQNGIVHAVSSAGLYAGTNLKLHGNGTDSFITESGSGNLFVKANDVVFNNADATQFHARFLNGGGVKLAYTGNTKLDTTNTGVSITGNSVVSGNVTAVDGTFSGNVSIGGVLTYEDVKNVDSVGIVTAREGVFIPDTKELKLGNTAASPDLKIYSTGTNGWVYTPQSGADLYMGTNAGEIYIQTGTGGNDTAIKVNSGGSVELNHITDKKFETTSSGATVTGTLTASSAKISDLTSGRVTYAGTDGRLVDSTELTYSGGLFKVAATYPTFYLDDTNTTNNRFRLTHNNELTQFEADPNNVYADSFMQFDIDGGEKLRITGDGKVGINSTSPTYALEVDGGTQNTVIVARSSDTRSQISFLDNATTGYGHVAVGCEGNDLFIRTGSGSKALTIDSSSRLLIGVTDTTNAHGSFDDLIVKASGGGNAGITIVTGTSNQATIAFSDGTSGTDQYRGYVQYSHNGDMLGLGAAGADRLQISNDGQVKVTGTNSGNHMTSFGSNVGGLTIDDVGGQHTGLEVSHGSNKVFLVASSNNSVYFSSYGTGSIVFEHTGGGGTRERLIIDGSGHLKISNNTAKIRMGSSNQLELYHNGTYGYLNDTSSSGTELRIAGRVVRVMDNDSSHTIAYFSDDAAKLYSGNSEKLATTSTGITVGGEVAASQDYPTIRPTLDLNFAATKTLDPRITFYRTGPASYVDEFGKIVFVGGSIPRFDHDPSTRECKGFLIEESRKNYLENGDFVSSYGSGNFWTYGVGTDVFSASSGSQLSTNPDGSSPAYHYAPSSTAGYHRFYRTVTVDAYDTSYVASVFVKRVTAGSASNLNRYFEIELSGNLSNNPEPTGHSGSHGMSSVTFDLQDLTSQYAGNSAVKVNGLVGDPKIEDYGNGWYRLSYVFNPGQFDANSTLTAHMWLGHPATLGSEAGNEQGNGNPSFYIWGAMVEKGSSLTSYIPNHGAYQTTRGADFALIDGEEFTDFFNQDEGTINCAYWLGNDNAGLRIFQINDSSNSVIDIVAGSGGGAGGYGYVNTGGSAQANGGQSSTNASRLNTLHVTTLAYKENDIAGINIKTGVLTNDTSATLDGAYNRVTFYQHSNSADQLNGHLQRVQYYPKRLPDNQLKNLNNQ